MQYLILTLYTAINICEAWLEDMVIMMKNVEDELYHRHNAQEHSRSLVFALLVAVPFGLAALYFHQYWLIPALLVNRRLFFDFGLKHFRGKPLHTYEGKGPFDRLFCWLFGPEGARKELELEIAVTLVSLTMTICKL